MNVPTDGTFVNQNVSQQLQINGIVSGSEYAGFPLGPEFGKSFDFGIVYDPHFIDGLSISSDIWRLYLNNNITGIGAQSVLDLCSAGQLVYCHCCIALRPVPTRARSISSTSRPSISDESMSKASTSH